MAATYQEATRHGATGQGAGPGVPGARHHGGHRRPPVSGRVKRAGGLGLLATAAAVLLGPAAVIGLNPAPAWAADVFVQVNPSTVQAGFMVGIRASCSENTAPATVESPAFGTVTAQPQDGVLTAAALVPENTDAGTYRVKLNCPDGRNATTMLNVVAAGRPERGPATGFGGTAGDDGDPGGLVLGGLATTALGAALGLVAVRRRGVRPPVVAARSRR
jgi:hypothetical protein